MVRIWMAVGVGGGDVPPMEAARSEASRAQAPGEAVPDILAVDNLCRRAAEGHAALPSALFEAPALGLVATRPRAVRALLDFAGVPRRDRDIRWVAAPASPSEGASLSLALLPDGPDWVPWYPVVEADRCTRCGQCVRFCLFGVYETGADGVPRVVRPRNCKNLCPACARLCPASALIFPRYAESPFNGDDIVEGDLVRLANRQTDMRRLLGDDPVAALRARQQRAAAQRPTGSLVDPARFEAALAERERHLCQAPSPQEGDR